MGLDSVELLMEFENYFGIRIPDSEAEETDTVQRMVDCVSIHLNITNGGEEFKENLLVKFSNAFQQTGIINKPLSWSDNLFQIIPSKDFETWDKVAKLLDSSILNARPKPEKKPPKLFVFLGINGMLRFQTLTTESFILAFCSQNYERLIESKKITNKFEIYIAIVGITSDKIGLDFHEIKPEKHFHKDLGIN